MPNKSEEEQKAELVKRIKEYVIEYLKKEKPYLLMIEEEVNDFLTKHQNGTVNFSVKIYRGISTEMIVEVLPHSETLKYVFSQK